MSTILVAVKYFWSGSPFYIGSLAHCVALPLEPILEDMRRELIKDIVPHFRFSSVPAGVRQTIASLPGYVAQPGDEWHLARLEYTENGYLFHDVPSLSTPKFFNEQALREEIVRVWGPAGAHVEVYDMLLAKAKEHDRSFNGEKVGVLAAREVVDAMRGKKTTEGESK